MRFPTPNIHGPEEVDALALSLVQGFRAIYEQPSEWVAVSPDDIPRGELALYDTALAALHGQRFRRLGDAENLSASRRRTPARAFVRCLVYEDGSTLAWLSCPRDAGERLSGKIDVTFLTEWSDGSAVTTNNRGSDALRSSPPGVQVVNCGETIELAEVFARHLAAVSEYAAEHADDRAAVSVQTLNDSLAASNSLRERVAEHRAKTGWIIPAEIYRIFRHRLPPATIREIVYAVQRITTPAEPVHAGEQPGCDTATAGNLSDVTLADFATSHNAHTRREPVGSLCVSEVT